MTRFLKTTLFTCAILSTSALTAIGCGEKDSSSSSTEPGKLDGACYDNGTCDLGLACRDKICVDLADGGTGPNSLACATCQQDSCEVQADACQQSATCGEYLTCVKECGLDATCYEGCPLAALTDVDMDLLVLYTTCIQGACVGACTELPTTGGGFDAAACNECGASSCATETEECNNAEGCPEARDCLLECGLDQTCLTGCDTSTLTASASAAVAGDYACRLASCVDECIPIIDVNPGTGGGGGNEGTGGGGQVVGCSMENARQGSCAGGNGQVCLGGEWTPEACDACAIVSPASTCAWFSAFALDANFLDVPGAVVDYQNTTSGVSATFNFSGVGQTGFIQLRLPANQAIPGATLSVSTTSGTVNATIERGDSSAGCQYSIASTGQLLQLANDGCWPGDGYYDPYLDGAEVINIRVSGVGAGTATLTVSGINIPL